MKAVYDNQFNQNEWFTIVLMLGFVIIFVLPKRFPRNISLLYILFGAAVGCFWDQLLAFPPVDFYDANDSSAYDLFDFLLYIAFSPYSYMMVYIFDWLKLGKQHVLLYILAMNVIGLGAEWVGHMMGVFHYKNGYKLFHSIPFYFISYSVLFSLYFRLYKSKEIQ